ncbi:MAG: hypothetical protein US11_C0001G0150 [Candidatus Roizmanbacteria bacterium GW2011_GWA2_36_23]|uniref:Uncharacterized protein n=1 Tax=Candidatus Roizmanbacteria bacterium GW2011_GWA2_36_23 TaxID=1618480 RepID=A0A0G0HE54_9BACT|nr:MAG: hypothetical protein US11_C0001G0150 [Candidatus Roizmanbacteria bacterium GW2011_GWA2_36_23]
MENILTLLTYLNKISILGFIITLFFVIYQIILIGRDLSAKKKKMIIPDFQDKQYITKTDNAKNSQTANNHFVKPSVFPLFLAMFFLLFFGMLALLGIIKTQSGTKVINIVPSPVIDYVVSSGIKVYNENWKELIDTDLKKLSPGQKIYVGIESVKSAGVDMARIRVNRTEWQADDVIIQYDDKKNLFYKEHEVATGEAYLKIDAQLHTKEDGWIGD